MIKIVIEREFAGTRLDKTISLKETKFSREQIQRLIEDNYVMVNGRYQKPSYRVKQNDVVEIEEPEVKESHIEAEDLPLNIVYEDKDILVVNKAKGMVVHPGNGNSNGTLVNAILSYCKDSLSGIGGEIRPGIVHRIDKDTSGLLIVAKNDTSHLTLSNMIKNHEVKKTYLALVRGNIKENEAKIDMPISRSKNDRVKMAVDRSGKNAVTYFKVLERFGDYTFIEVQIETGRTHQIRVHMSQIGYPIVGDYVYSNGKNPFGVEGQMLHSSKLEFKHPITGKDMTLEAPLPEYFEEVLEILRNSEQIKK